MGYCKVNKIPGLDGIYPWLFREKIVRAFLKTFPSSLVAGEVPENWTVGKVVLLFKKERKSRECLAHVSHRSGRKFIGEDSFE